MQCLQSRLANHDRRRGTAQEALRGAPGHRRQLKPGAEVDVVIEAAVEDTIKKSDPPLAVRSA